MMRKFICVAAWVIASAVAVQAAPSPTPAPATQRASSETGTSAKKARPKKGKKARNKPLLNVTPATPLPLGWSILNGEWVHSDGYKYVEGQVVRTGSQTHKTPPKPPSKAQRKAVEERTRPVEKPPADSAATKAAKAAEVQRNKMPSRPASQTGSHL